MTDTQPYVMVALGGKRAASDADWIASGLVRRVVRFEGAAPSGFRLGRRIFGLGLDSAIVALKVAVSAPRGPYLAANPWVAVALRMLVTSAAFLSAKVAMSKLKLYARLRACQMLSAVAGTLASSV